MKEMWFINFVIIYGIFIILTLFTSFLYVVSSSFLSLLSLSCADFGLLVSDDFLAFYIGI